MRSTRCKSGTICFRHLLVRSRARNGHGLGDKLTSSRKSKKTITSLQGEKMQAQVWKEIIGVLKEVDPEVEKIAGL